MNRIIQNIFGVEKPVIGMIHLHALPGTPSWKGNLMQVLETALEEAVILKQAGYDSLAMENMHDTPYLNRIVGPEIVASMCLISKAIVEETKMVCGIQVLAGANKEALAIAQSARLSFIRAEGFVFSHVADEGMMHSDAGELLRYRKNISAEEIAIFTDIKKKHSAHAITADVSLADTAKTAEFMRSDGLVVTGSHTGEPASPQDLKDVRSASKLPIIVGSGLTNQNIKDFFPLADAFIVGSYLKKDGLWSNEMDPERVKKFIDAAKG